MVGSLAGEGFHWTLSHAHAPVFITCKCNALLFAWVKCNPDPSMNACIIDEHWFLLNGMVQLHDKLPALLLYYCRDNNQRSAQLTGRGQQYNTSSWWMGCPF
jgi:hypothetical protein